MERQVRFAADTIVLVGLLLGLLVHPTFQILSAGIASGLVFSALSNTCGMAAMLANTTAPMLPSTTPSPNSATADTRMHGGGLPSSCVSAVVRVGDG
jgi:hypothetical protein